MDIYGLRYTLHISKGWLSSVTEKNKYIKKKKKNSVGLQILNNSIQDVLNKI